MFKPWCAVLVLSVQVIGCVASNGVGDPQSSTNSSSLAVQTPADPASVPSVTCSSDQTLYDSQCYDNTKTCPIANGSGQQTFANGSYGACAAVSCASGYTLASGSCTKTNRTRFVGALDLGNGRADLLFQMTNGDLKAWVGNGGYDFGDVRDLTFGGRPLSYWNPAGTTKFIGAFDLGNGHADLLFQESNGDLKAWVGNGGYDFGDVRNLTFGTHPLSYWNPAGTTKFIGAFDLGNGHADLLFQESNGDLKAWVGNGGYDFGDLRNLTFGTHPLSYWNPNGTTRFVGAVDLGNGHADLLFQESNGDLKAWVGNGGYDFGDVRNLTFGTLALSTWNPQATTTFIGAYDLGNGHKDLLFQEANQDLKGWIGNGGFDFGDVRNLTFGSRVLSQW